MPARPSPHLLLSTVLLPSLALSSAKRLLDALTVWAPSPAVQARPSKATMRHFVRRERTLLVRVLMHVPGCHLRVIHA